MARDIQLQLYLFTIGYYVEHIGNAVMIYKLHKQRSMYGISIDTQICLLISTIARVFWMNDTQLIRLNMAYLEIVMAVILHLYLVYLCHSYKDSIYKGLKQFYLKSPFLVIISFILSTIFHPGSKGEYFVSLQMMVSFTIFLEAFSMIPQLVHLRTGKDPEGLTTSYLYCLGGSRGVRFFFWIAMYSSNDTFWYLMLADFLHTGLLFYFFYTFKQTVKKGGQSVLGFHDQMDSRRD